MSIRARINEAESFWSQDNTEGAWLMALIAAAATARRRYPLPMSDSQAFKTFIRDITSIIMTGNIAGPSPTCVRFYSDDISDERNLEDMFYKELRCQLVHEGELKEVGFSKSRIEDGQLVADLSVPTRVQAQIPDFWVKHLIAAIKAAPENATEFNEPA